MRAIADDYPVESGYHFLATYFLAREAGFSEPDARFMAERSRALDEGWTDPRLPWTHWDNHFIPEEEAQRRFDSAYQTWIAYRQALEGHSPSDGSPQGRVKERLLTRMGEALHNVTDSVAHRGYSKFVGHLFDGTAPDLCRRRPARCEEANAKVRDSFAQANLEPNREANPFWVWLLAAPWLTEVVGNPLDRLPAIASIEALWTPNPATEPLVASFTVSENTQPSEPTTPQPTLVAALPLGGR